MEATGFYSNVCIFSKIFFSILESLENNVSRKSPASEDLGKPAEKQVEFSQKNIMSGKTSTNVAKKNINSKTASIPIMRKINISSNS